MSPDPAMKRRAWFALIVVALVLVALPLSEAWAGGGWRGGHGGHGGHGRVFIGTSFWFGPPWPYYYPYYYYPYPYAVYAPAPVIVEQPVYTQQPEPPARPEGYWYYCDSAKAYYPSVPMCAEAWIKVPPRSE